MYFNRGLVDRDWSIAHRMSQTRRPLIAKCLNTAKEAHENKCRQAKKNQIVITRFFSKHIAADAGGKLGSERKGSAVVEEKRCGDSDRRAVFATQVVTEEGALMLGKPRIKDKERKESDVLGPAQEVLGSDSEESELSGLSCFSCKTL